MGQDSILDGGPATEDGSATLRSVEVIDVSSKSLDGSARRNYGQKSVHPLDE